MCESPFHAPRLFQVLIQEIGLNVDMNFILAIADLLANLPSGVTEVIRCYNYTISLYNDNNAMTMHSIIGTSTS